MKAVIACAALAVFGLSGTALAQDGGVGAEHDPAPSTTEAAAAPPRDAGDRRRERARASASDDAPPERRAHPGPEESEGPAGPSAPVVQDEDAGVEVTDGGAAALAGETSVDELDGGVPDAGSLDTAVDVSAADAGATALEGGDAGADVGAAQGEVSPVAPPASEEEGPKRDLFSAFSNWLWEQAERQPVARETTPSEAVTPPPVRESVGESMREWLDVVLPARRVSSVGLVFFLALAILSVWLVDKAREPLPERGVIPRMLSAAHLLLRLAIAVMVFLLISRFVPSWLRPALFLSFAAVAVAIGFGVVWLLLPDVVGAVVLLTERRLKRGQWVVGEGFAGTVEELGLRVTVLRATDGSLLSVPNRRVVKSPVRTSDRLWHEIDVELRSPEGAEASQVRSAIQEAVLCSPYVPPNPGLVLSRNPLDPMRWRMKVRLIDVRFSEAFEGEILERIEESLARGLDDVVV